jgi:integrase/recombinase XerD
MVTTNQTQRISWIAAAEDDLVKQVEAFLLDRRIRGLAPGTLRFYRQKLVLFQTYCHQHGVGMVSKLSPTLIRQYLLWLSETGHNSGGVHGCYRALRAFLNWWEEEYEPENWRNPIRKVKGPKVSAEPLPPADWDAVKAMADTCKGGATAARDRALLLFLVDTGCRAGEALSIDLDDYDPIVGAVTVRKGKGGKGRTVYVGRQTRRAMRKYLRQRQNIGPLWQTVHGGRLSYDGLRAVITRRAKQADVEPPSLHSFRRLFALACLRNGMDLRRLQELMGHSTLNLLQRYTRLTDADVKAAHHKASPVDRGW